jgi:DNA sulfur modification protein DndD
MRITNIDITNYRQYHSLSFAFPASKSNDIHIIVAQNGVGKTNLLNAITWCLYGKEPHLSDDTEDLGLPKLNLTAIKEAKAVGNDIEYVEVVIRAKDGDEYITYKRRLPVRVIPGIFEEIAKEEFTVTVATSAGDPKVYEDKKETRRLVDKYMPERIREYFYFDGEQLNSYFISARKGKVKEAIFAISQVDNVNLIDKRIGEIIGDKQRDAASKAPDIKKVKDALDETDNLIMSVEEKIKNHEEQIAKSDRIIKENTEYLQGEENLPDLEKQYQELKASQKNLEDEKKELMESMFSFVREMKAALTFYAVAKKTLSIITQKEAEKALPPNIDKALLIKALEDHTCTVCNQPLSENNEDFIKHLIDSFQVSSTTSHLLMGIRSELARIVKAAETYPSIKKGLIEKYQRIENQLSEVEIQLADVDKCINRISDKEEVKRRYTERQENEEIRKINIEKLGVAKDQISKAQEEKEKLNKDLEKALEKDAECTRIRQLIEFATKARKVIGSVEEEMMNEVRVKMEERTTYYFMKLIWKRNTYDRIVLNNEFHLDLIHKDGYSCVGTCSAAERCLLALSFTLALHEVSGFNSLLFIDTPVARVSDINRLNFANVLCEVSRNKQIIMAFSPDEYSPEIKKIFDPAARTNVELSMVDEKVTVLK